MFSFFGKKNKEVKMNDGLFAPVDGEFLPLEQVSDPVFAGKQMGDGFALIPKKGVIVSPVSGTVTMVADTEHAVGFETGSGLEVLLHLGLDTVNMGGTPFNLTIKTGDVVDGGDSIGTMSLTEIDEAGYDTAVLVIVTNMASVKSLSMKPGEYQAGEEVGKAIAK